MMHKSKWAVNGCKCIALNEMHFLDGKQADPGSTGQPHCVPWPRQVWDRDTCRFPTVPQPSLSFSQSKNKSVCLTRNCKEVRSVVC